MQLILDAENIDIERNMSTIEHEPLNEKFLTNKVIDRLADDITTGNKENIQKQENIIQDVEETNIVDNDKATVSGDDDILINNPNVDKSYEDPIDMEDVRTLEKTFDEKSSEKALEQTQEAVVSQNISEEKLSPKANETKLVDRNNEDLNEKELSTENKNNVISLDKNPIVEVPSTVDDNNSLELSNEWNEDKEVELDNEVDISELSAELNEEKEMDLDKELDIAEVSNELNEEKEMDSNKEEDDIAGILTELSEEKEIDLDKEDDISEVLVEVTEAKKNNLDEEDDIAEVSSELNEEKVLNSDKEHDNVEISTGPNEVKEVDLDKDNIAEISTELNKEKEVNLDKEADIAKVAPGVNEDKEMSVDKKDDVSKDSTALNEDIAMDLHKEDDIAEVSTGLNEEKEMDLDKEADIAVVSTEPIIENDIAMDVEKAMENDLDKQSVQSEVNVPSANLNDDSQEGDCSVVEATLETNEKNTAIEIDDEDEKLGKNNVVSHENIEEVPRKLDENKAESTKEITASSSEDTTINLTSKAPVQPKRICRLSNNLDIFSDEEDDDQPSEKSPNDNIQPVTEKHCINIDDDDDIMLIDEDLGAKDIKKKDMTQEVNNTNFANDSVPSMPENTQNDLDSSTETKEVSDATEKISPGITENKDTNVPVKENSDVPVIETDKTAAVKPEEKEKIKKPLLPKNFLETCKKNLSDMTRGDLEEFCILKIVESIVDRSNLGEIKAHLKNLTQTMEDCKKKCLILTKQNKDLQIVLKSVQDEQKSGSDVHITPLKITRSVGMQVMMVADKNAQKRKAINGVGVTTPTGPVLNNNTKQVKNQTPNTRNQKEKVPVNQQIPVPRLVPAAPVQSKTNPATTSTPTKPVNNTTLPNGVRNSPPVQKVEKRPRSQAVTVDLTDDEPPPKLQNVQRGPVTQAMRVLTTGPNLVPVPRFAQNINSPRKVYIPISGPQAQNVRPGQTLMLKALTGLGPRPRTAGPALIPKAPTSSPMRYGRGQPSRHPAPLPDAMKQYQPPNWKALPPAPDLKLSKVENGIVISWKIDDYQEDNHEEIASYQLYAYQETTSPPNTALWKKIGDVKALPLPMACTLTQFMAGYKYYFAVRAVDIRSRFGPFSLPGSILLLNKM